MHVELCKIVEIFKARRLGRRNHRSVPDMLRVRAAGRCGRRLGPAIGSDHRDMLGTAHHPPGFQRQHQIGGAAGLFAVCDGQDGGPAAQPFQGLQHQRL